jgi:hypothetical protein
MLTQNYDNLKEYAIFNIEKLFTFWKIKYVKISPEEYDFINPTRNDRHFGACRFNCQKGVGGDFTGTTFTQSDYTLVSSEFDSSDFEGINSSNKKQWGFDIIGLTQRIYNLNTYRDAAMLLKNDLGEIRKLGDLIVPSETQIADRKSKVKKANDETIQFARKTWGWCKEYQNTLGQIYLESRCIYLEKHQSSIKFHHTVLCKEAGKPLPCLLFRVSQLPGSPIEAIHRVYLDPFTGDKAKLGRPKMALGQIKGNAIWFGELSSTLCIAEGPENALSVLSFGYQFVCSAVNAANMANLSIPREVKKIILFADTGVAGESAAKNAHQIYTSQGYKVIIKYPNRGDWNDVLIEAHKNARK